MNILDDIVSTLNLEAAVQDVRQGPFQTAVLTRNCGLASTPHEVGYHQNHAMVMDAGTLADKPSSALVRMAYSDSPFEAAIGMATINSLLEIDEARCVDLNAGDLLAAEGRGKKIALIGHFPFVPKLSQSASEVWVIERRPQEGDLSAEEAERLVPQADVVGITGTALANHTIDRLIELCRPDAYIVVLGGTTPLSPVLFDYGVDAVSGTRV